MNLYALFGNPVTHSQSPLIHHLFAQQTQQQISYSAIHVELNALAKALDDFQAQGGKGANITLPFKQAAFLLVDSTSERAKYAQAINTICFAENGERFGDNTDGIGLVRDLTVNQGISIDNKRILILGAGGAARGILGPLLAERPAGIMLANRTVSKASELAKQFTDLGPVQACAWSALESEPFDLIINATSAGLYGEVVALPDGVFKNAACYDLAYGPAARPFLQQAKQQGAQKCCDGLGMLIEQAAESFYIWRNIKPDTKALLSIASPLVGEAAAVRRG